IALIVASFYSFSLFCGEEKVACPNCGFLNSPEDRYCVECLYEIRPLSKEDLQKISQQTKEKVLESYEKAKENFFKGQNNVDKSSAKFHYELALSYAEKALREGRERLSVELRKELKTISWLCRQRLSLLREITKAPLSRIKLIRRDKAYFIAVTLNEKVEAVLHLDTGCSTTLISQDIAEKLSLSGGKEVSTVLADGTKVKSKSVMLDSIAAGEQKVRNVPVVIMDTTGDGLLGMSFLRYFIFKIDTQTDELVLQRK
ncbi:MAG: aspartyl protease family protein, partial [Candidatus Aureabacteria bacterium]|nr:aspartyl protease family protein [Candidatus Auribacterota bacterium]